MTATHQVSLILKLTKVIFKIAGEIKPKCIKRNLRSTYDSSTYANSADLMTNQSIIQLSLYNRNESVHILVSQM